MAGGYFDDGTVQVALGAHVFATPAARRSNLLMTPFCSPALALHVGGGVLELTVTGQAVRDNLGDAERYAAELLRALATSGPGTLGVEDDLGRRAAFASSVCTGAVAEVRAFRFVEVQVRLRLPGGAGRRGLGRACPMRRTPTPAPRRCRTTRPAAWRSASAAACASRCSGATRCGRCPARAAPARAAPERRPPAPDRHRPPAGETTTWPRRSEDLERSIGAGPVDLTANGNTYADVVLECRAPQARRPLPHQLRRGIHPANLTSTDTRP